VTHGAWVSSVIYGTTLVLLYLFSTLYHSVRGPLKPLFRRLDHCAIFLLIAGSLHPVCVGHLAWPMGLGAVCRQLDVGGDRHRAGTARWSALACLSIAVYVVMGWMVLFAIVPLMNALPKAGMVWLAGRWLVLYRRRGVLRAGQEIPAFPRHLALVRDGRQRLPVCQHFPLRWRPVRPRGWDHTPRAAS
jgi:channel protein (hemolysin III family)